MNKIIEEIWTPIPNYDNFYLISNFGRIKSVSRNIPIVRGNQKYFMTHAEILLKPKITWDGYHEVTLTYNTIKKCFRAHRLVAQGFIPNPNNKPEVNHKDGIKLNNRIDNLEWVTTKENAEHAQRMGLIRRSRGSELSKLTENEVLVIRKLYANGDFKQIELAKLYNVGKNCIWYIIKRTTWKHI